MSEISNVRRILASNPNTVREEHDFYATDPIAIDSLIKLGGAKLKEPLLECACGKGHLSERLKDYGYEVRSMDLIDRGYGETGVDFLQFNEKWNGDIITNPPFKLSQEFVEHALEILETRGRAYMFLRLQWLEGLKRKDLYDKMQLKTIYVYSDRVCCSRHCDFTEGSAVAYAWFEFEKDWNDEPKIKWLNTKDLEQENQQTLF